MQANWSEVAEKLAVDPSVEFEDSVQLYNAVWTSAEPTTDDALNDVHEKKDWSFEDAQTNEGAEAVLVDRREESISTARVRTAIGMLRMFLGNCTDVTDALYESVNDVKSITLHLPEKDYRFLPINVRCSTACNALLIGNDSVPFRCRGRLFFLSQFNYRIIRVFHYSDILE